jgi:hypothetical protein
MRASDLPLKINTAPLRALLSRISNAALELDINSHSDQASKLSGLMISLTKTIRETEIYNQKIEEDLEKSQNEGASGTLEERLKGYAPSASELQRLRAELKERLVVLGPRLFANEDSNASELATE